MTESAGARSDDPFTQTAGAYVLGALEDAERTAFDAHLTGCAACREAVDDVAHLPALLATVPPGGMADPPPTVLARLLAAIAGDDVTTRRQVRRRRLWTGGGLVGAAAAGFLAGALLLPPTGDADDGPDGPDARSDDAVVTSVVLTTTATLPVSASVDLEPAPWGTRLSVSCRYEDVGAPYAGGAPIEYALVVRDAAGNGQQVATWLAAPGDAVTVPASTALEAAEIAGLEMTSGGEVWLSAEL